MLTQMSVAQLQVPAAVVQVDVHAPMKATQPADSGMHHDCHAGAQDSTSTSDAGCQVCELCAPFGAAQVADTLAGNARPERPDASPAAFRSAESRHALDPPR